MYGALRSILDGIPKRATTVLTSARRKPWTASGLSSAIQRAKEAAKWEEKDLHFHDLRGTAVTKFYVGDLSVRVIAEIWAGRKRPPNSHHQGDHRTTERRQKPNRCQQNRLQNSRAKMS
jgi:hypothetical protein